MEQVEAIVQKTGGARLKQGGAGPKIVLGVLGGLIALLAAGYLALCLYAVRSARIWRDTYVLGQDIGGLTREQAVQRVDGALPGLEIGLYLYDGALEYPPEHQGRPDAAIPLSDLDARIDTGSLVEGADREARRGSFFTAGWRYLIGENVYYGGGAEDITVPEAAAKAAAEAALEELAWSAQDTAYRLGDNALLVTMAKDGRAIDARDLQEALSKGFWDLDLTLDVPYSVPPAKTMTAQEIHDAVHGEMKNAGYDAVTGTITPEQVGADFDVSAAQKLMDGAAPGETVSIPAQIQYPAVTAEELKEVLFRNVLGEAVTRVGGTAARISNVRLAASAVDGTVLNPGDVFSYNETVGQRTAAKGYQAAPAYVQGETVDEIGGGVCQPSSTLYLACLLSDLEIVQRQAHRYVPSYIDPGMDATVSWGGPDYRFKNDTDYPLKIQAVYDKGRLTMRILGTKTDGTTVRMTSQHLSTTPFQTVYEDDPTLAPGEERVKTTPYTGHRYKTFRERYDGDGRLIERVYEATSDYKSRDKVVLRAPEVPAAGTDPLPGELPPDPGTGETSGPAGGPGSGETSGSAGEPGSGEAPPLIFLPEDGTL